MPTPRLVPRIYYEFLVSGELSDRALAAFPAFTVSRRQHEFTALHGPVADNSDLRGVLARFDALGLSIVEMRRLFD